MIWFTDLTYLCLTLHYLKVSFFLVCCASRPSSLYTCTRTHTYTRHMPPPRTSRLATMTQFFLHHLQAVYSSVYSSVYPPIPSPPASPRGRGREWTRGARQVPAHALFSSFQPERTQNFTTPSNLLRLFVFYWCREPFLPMQVRRAAPVCLPTSCSGAHS